ncbi:MAG: cysteine desulfurase [Proteobacteria bacterium]|nr:cysteine desulfurase [Pseudomonadota bacterium]
MTKNRTIFLDHNATTPLHADVAAVMQSLYGDPLNASSVHSYGRAAKKWIEGARANIGALVQASPSAHQVIFTSSGTEANNLAMNGLDEKFIPIVSAIEHVSVLKANKKAQILPVDANGVVRLDALRRMLENLQGEKALVSVMLANNETGVIQPVQQVAELVYAFGGFVHTDAAQAIGKIPVSIQDLNVDMMTISAHKFGGPQGAAALIIKKGVVLAAQLKGGGQELGYRAGTENVAAIAGFGKAAELVKESLARMHAVKALRDSAEAELKAAGATVFGAEVSRLPNTLSVAMPHMNSETQLIAFDLEGIAVSAGSACSSGKVETSHVLKAMQADAALVTNAIRVSLGAGTAPESVSAFVAQWKKLAEQSAKRKAA